MVLNIWASFFIYFKVTADILEPCSEIILVSGGVAILNSHI